MMFAARMHNGFTGKVLKSCLDERFPGIFSVLESVQGFRLLATAKVTVRTKPLYPLFWFLPLPRSKAEELSPFQWEQEREAALKHGQWLIPIWEDQWNFKRAALLSRIAALLGVCKRIHGRETELKRVISPVAEDFLAQHHLLVPLKGKFRLGLYHRGELVTLAVFSGPRKMKDKGEDYVSYELLRFCHAGGHLVNGGLSKLINGFAQQFKPQDMMTYVDLDWSAGEAFIRQGFECEGRRPPQVFWVHQGRRYYPKQLPETLRRLDAETLRQKGYFSIYNNGSLKLIRRF